MAAARSLAALHEIPALRRLAFITSHPNFLGPDLVAAIAELPKVARYLHLPAQSGSNAVLKAMRRGYTVERYLARVEQLFEKAPDVELHSDFIVGYPGETVLGKPQAVYHGGRQPLRPRLFHVLPVLPDNIVRAAGQAPDHTVDGVILRAGCGLCEKERGLPGPLGHVRRELR